VADPCSISNTRDSWGSVLLISRCVRDGLLLEMLLHLVQRDFYKFIVSVPE